MGPVDSPTHEGPAETKERPVRKSSYNGIGISEALDVIQMIEAAGVPCCVVGGRALKYYGVPRVASAWHICMPTEKLDEVRSMFDREEPLRRTFEPATQKILPQVRTLLHTYPHLKMREVDFALFLVPSWEYFPSDSGAGFGPDKFERSRHFQVPYPKLEYLAQGLLDTQRWADAQELIDGMDLTEAWAEARLDLDKPPEIAYARAKNERIANSLAAYPGSIPSTLSEKPPDLRTKWKRLVSGKEKRIDVLAPKGKYVTRYRKTGSPDPRLKEDRIC